MTEEFKPDFRNGTEVLHTGKPDSTRRGSGMVHFQAWHGMTLPEHEALRDQWAAQGYRIVSLSIYGSVDAPVFAAVMVEQAEPVAQRDFPVMTATQWQLTFDIQAAQGYGPIILAATGTADDPRFAAVFEPQASIPLTRHGLTSGAYTDPATIQGTNFAARAGGLILSWAASYGTPADPRHLDAEPRRDAVELRRAHRLGRRLSGAL